MRLRARWSVALAALCLIPAPALSQADAPPVRLVLAVSDSAVLDSEVARGVRFGVEEATQTAALLGRRVTLEAVTGTAAKQLAAAVRALAPDAVLSALPAAATDSLALLLEPILTVNLAAPPDSLPRAAGAPHVLHVVPATTERMAAAPATRIIAWHPELVRYGAAQLNDRYRRRHEHGMREASWLGWFAVKAITETALRQQRAGTGSLAAAVRAVAGFDGHKGVALRFDPETGVLRQPLYRVDGKGEMLGEVSR